LLWGAIPALTFPRLFLPLVIALLVGIDLLVMPAAGPVVQLGSRWLLGEMVALMLCLLPAQLLARWTIDDRCLTGRVLLQMGTFAGLMLGDLPAAIIQLTGGSWRPLLERPMGISGIAFQILALPAILGLTAVQDFAAPGGGTPFPYDPPKRLVTSGVYSYVANPMQMSMVLLLTGWGLLLWNGWVAAAGLMGLVYSLGLAAWDEGGELSHRFGGAWRAYRRSVPRWWPRWRPWCPTVPRVEPGSRVAHLYVAASCGLCAELGRWLQRRHPTGLVVAAAEDHPSRDLYRLTYVPPAGEREEEGVAALARSLEHLQFAWAFAGWTMRLPLVRQSLQLLTDAVGGEPRRIPRRHPTADGCSSASLGARAGNRPSQSAPVAVNVQQQPPTVCNQALTPRQPEQQDDRQARDGWSQRWRVPLVIVIILVFVSGMKMVVPCCP